MIAFDLSPKFSPGQVVITANVQSQVAREDVLAAQGNHEHERSPLEGCRLLSAYRAGNGIQFWLLTE